MWIFKPLGADSCWKSATPKSYIESVEGLGHVELVYGVHDDGGSGEEGEQEQEQEVDHHVAAEPGNSLHWEIFPKRWRKKGKKQDILTTVTHNE